MPAPTGRRLLLATVVATVLVAGACAGPTRTVTQGDGARVVVEDGPHSVLAAVVTVETDQPTRPRVTARSGDGHEVTLDAPERAAARHELALVGLRAERDYVLTVDGSPSLERLTADGAVVHRTGALPDDLPPVEVVASDDARPGFTLFNASFGDRSVRHPANLVMVDHEGEVVWYLQSDRGMADVRQLPNGNLLVNHDSTGAREIDVLGRVVREWTTTARVAAGRFDRTGEAFFGPDAAVLDTSRLHHEVAHPRPDGRFLALGQEVRTVDGFAPGLCPAGEDPFPGGARPIRSDLVLEFDADGTIHRRVALLDAVDPTDVPGFAQCEARRDPLLFGGRDYVDWTHGNSAEVFDERNLLLVSARNISSILALRWEDDADGPAGELLWRLGPGGDFDLAPGGEWFHAQHAPELYDDGTILVYDNGNDRPGTVPAGGDEPPYSRAVLYRLTPPDEPGSRGTATQLWEHRVDGPTPGDPPEYATFLGDADRIGDGHVLITHGGIGERGAGNLRSRVVEVDERTGDVVLDVRIGGEPGTSWRTYRAEHLDALHPQG